MTALTDLPGWAEYQAKKDAHRDRIARACGEYQSNHPDELRELKADERRGQKRDERRAKGIVTEHEEQVDFVAWLDARGIRYFAVPNGVALGLKGTALYSYRAYLKAEGLRAGAPDLVIVDPIPGSRVHVVVEMKSRTGRETPEQRAFLDEMESRGWMVLVAHGRDEAVRMMTEAGY